MEISARELLRSELTDVVLQDEAIHPLEGESQDRKTTKNAAREMRRLRERAEGGQSEGGQHAQVSGSPLQDFAPRSEGLLLRLKDGDILGPSFPGRAPDMITIPIRCKVTSSVKAIGAVLVVAQSAGRRRHKRIG